MIYQRGILANGESQAVFRVITDPVEILLEYRLIALDAPKPPSIMTDKYYGGLGPDVGVRYCILIIANDRFGGSETKLLYDITREQSVAEALLKTLCDGAVTPCTAKYVIEDLL